MLPLSLHASDVDLGLLFNKQTAERCDRVGVDGLLA